MNLTKNEKSTIGFLIQNARITDAEIARRLKISLQAVRNIRKKLERKQVIRKYSAIINYETIDINLFAIALVKVTPEAWDKYNEKQIKDWLLHPNVIHFYRVPNGNITHIIKYGFNDLNEMNSFFQILQSKYSKYITIENSYIISNGNIIRDSNQLLVSNAINGRNGTAKPHILK